MATQPIGPITLILVIIVMAVGFSMIMKGRSGPPVIFRTLWRLWWKTIWPSIRHLTASALQTVAGIVDALARPIQTNRYTLIRGTGHTLHGIAYALASTGRFIRPGRRRKR